MELVITIKMRVASNVCALSLAGWRIVHCAQRKSILNSVEAGRCGQGSTIPDMAAILHPKSDLTLVKMEHGNSSLI